MVTVKQLSEAVAFPNCPRSTVLTLHGTVVSPGQVICGGTFSIIVINVVHLATLPHESVAVNITGVVPTSNNESVLLLV